MALVAIIAGAGAGVALCAAAVVYMALSAQRRVVIYEVPKAPPLNAALERARAQSRMQAKATREHLHGRGAPMSRGLTGMHV